MQIQVCSSWEIVSCFRVKIVLFIFVPSVLTRHSKYLINIGSVLHTYCEAEQVLSFYRERIMQLGDGRPWVC